MAAELQPKPLTRKPILLQRMEGSQEVVNMAVIVPKEEGVISVSEDRTVRVWLKRDSGQYWPSIYHAMPSPCSCMSFNPETRRLSIGLDNGTISEFILSEDYNKMTPVKNYQGGVTALCWDPVQRVLFSGSSDHSVIMWDIGGRKGTAIELQGHNDKVQALSYAQHTRQLISCGGDGGIVVWNMDVERQETPEWLDSDSCQKCDQPFFWNFKQMWDSKKIGLRQHHCRKCGKAVCGKCSSKRSSIPLMGFEFEVRVCDSCHEAITDEERAPTATFHDSKHNIVHVHFDATRGWLLTSGTDKPITGDLPAYCWLCLDNGEPITTCLCCLPSYQVSCFLDFFHLESARFGETPKSFGERW
ncbi:WD repeat and FYVE domain-containing protein 2 isoform X4 [Hylobates moloch]|uniref:WD repeat and FYVE domain-containing protein 2 isoform X4 n=1 Tax=Hylobates moloch TaxID=81572 RepID=UPI0026762433|nr:WD repeat and FYVE domain-containing protein 2 isoform X4 [Hylobates moloch]